MKNAIAWSGDEALHISPTIFLSTESKEIDVSVTGMEFFTAKCWRLVLCLAAHENM